MRGDIYGHLSLSEMTLDELTFRRNGHLHDIEAHRRLGDSQNREKILASQNYLQEVEAHILERLAGENK